MASCFRSRAAFGFLSVSSDSSRHHALYNFYFESEREAESDRFGLPAHPRSAAPKIAINFSSATEFSSWEGRHADDAGRARSEQRSPLLPFLFPPRFFLLAVRTRSWRVAFVARVHYFYSLSLRICSRGALARALVSKVTAFRRAGELSVCLSGRRSGAVAYITSTSACTPPKSDPPFSVTRTTPSRFPPPPSLIPLWPCTHVEWIG